MDIKPITGLAATPARIASEDQAAMKAAQAFEAAYLTEMLKHSGINALPEGFGGGAGEDAFSGFLTQEYARLLSERGGVGLAEQIFEAIKARSTGA